MFLEILFFVLEFLLLKILFRQNWIWAFVLFAANIAALIVLGSLSCFFTDMLIENFVVCGLSPLLLNNMLFLGLLYVFLLLEGKKFNKSNNLIFSVNVLFDFYTIPLTI